MVYRVPPNTPVGERECGIRAHFISIGRVRLDVLDKFVIRSLEKALDAHVVGVGFERGRLVSLQMFKNCWDISSWKKDEDNVRVVLSKYRQFHTIELNGRIATRSKPSLLLQWVEHGVD